MLDVKRKRENFESVKADVERRVARTLASTIKVHTAMVCEEQLKTSRNRMYRVKCQSSRRKVRYFSSIYMKELSAD